MCFFYHTIFLVRCPYVSLTHSIVDKSAGRLRHKTAAILRGEPGTNEEKYDLYYGRFIVASYDEPRNEYSLAERREQTRGAQSMNIRETGNRLIAKYDRCETSQHPKCTCIDRLFVCSYFLETATDIWIKFYTTTAHSAMIYRYDRQWRETNLSR